MLVELLAPFTCIGNIADTASYRYVKVSNDSLTNSRHYLHQRPEGLEATLYVRSTTLPRDPTQPCGCVNVDSRSSQVYRGCRNPLPLVMPSAECRVE